MSDKWACLSAHTRLLYDVDGRDEQWRYRISLKRERPSDWDNNMPSTPWTPEPATFSPPAAPWHHRPASLFHHDMEMALGDAPTIFKGEDGRLGPFEVLAPRIAHQALLRVMYNSFDAGLIDRYVDK